MASPWTLDVGDDGFEREVLTRSAETPIVVDFWAPWCAPCRALGPLLERLADEHAGAFRLVRVNVDEAPATAERYDIRSIPAVLAFRDGGLVAEFVGAQPEPIVRRLVEAALPTEADRLAREAGALAASGRDTDAEAVFQRALALEPRHAKALLGLARLTMERSVPEALALLERVPPNAPVAKDAERLAAELRTRGDGAGDAQALRARLSSNPDDLHARLQLGRTLGARGEYEAALAELLEVVKRDPRFEDGAARAAMVDMFAVLGNEHALTDRFRSELAKALYR